MALDLGEALGDKMEGIAFSQFNWIHAPIKGLAVDVVILRTAYKLTAL